MFVGHTSVSWARRLLSTFRSPVLAWGPGAVMCGVGRVQSSPTMLIGPRCCDAQGGLCAEQSHDAHILPGLRLKVTSWAI